MALMNENRCRTLRLCLTWSRWASRTPASRAVHVARRAPRHRPDLPVTLPERRLLSQESWSSPSRLPRRRRSHCAWIERLARTETRRNLGQRSLDPDPARPEILAWLT